MDRSRQTLSTDPRRREPKVVLDYYFHWSGRLGEHVIMNSHQGKTTALEISPEYLEV
jgi:hypothetical protein